MSTSLFGVGASVTVNVNGSLVPQSFTGLAGQTVFVLTNFQYIVGTNSLLVFINGQRQILTRDFTETSPNSFTLVEGVVAGDFVDVIGFPQVALTAVTAGSVTSTQPSSGVTRQLQSKLADGYNVKDFNCACDGVTDDTINLQIAITVCTLLGVELFIEGVLIHTLITIPGANAQLTGINGGTLRQKPQTYPGIPPQIVFSGANPTVKNLVMDGNQGNMIAGQGSNVLALLATATTPTFINVRVINSADDGMTLYSSNGGLVTNNKSKGKFIGCNFDDNGGLGMNTFAANYHVFEGCTFDRNGYGFHGSRSSYADNNPAAMIAFGFALRMRSHHLEFIGCSARDNGRDGMNTNQGTYAIKYVSCLAYGNGDGGFTLAADNTGTGLPGEGEGCYDLEYIDCEAYNNYSSGLAAYQAMFNVTVQGGRYYNNNRLAGDQASSSSFLAGIYFAAGSQGITIDSKAYDDRQFRPITAVAGAGSTRTLTATGWLPGGMLFYPKVSIYNAALVWQGYGKITAESAGSVTIQATVANFVNLAGVAAGMFITQAVQHAGALMDNSCIALMAIDGFGHRTGPAAAFTGRNMAAGMFGNNQNVCLPKERRSDVELITNPSFDTVVTGWTYSVVGGSANFYTGTFKRSPGALQLVGGAGAVAEGDATLITSAMTYCVGEFIEFGGWVYAVNNGDAFLILFSGGGAFSSGIAHPGGGWKYLKIGIQVVSDDTGIVCRVRSAQGKTNYFDSMSCRVVDSHIDNREAVTPSRYLFV